MASATFVLKDPNGEKETAVFLLFYFKGERLKYSINEKILPELWDKKAQRAKEGRKFPGYSEFNTKLDTISYRARNAFRKFENDKARIPTKGEFKEVLDREFGRGNEIEVKDLFAFIEKFIERARLRVNVKTGKAISEATIHVYEVTLRLLKDFKRYTSRRVDFDTIDLEFYDTFMEYMIEQKGFSNNTLGKHIKTLKVFLSDAQERGIVVNMAYKSRRFRVLTENTDSIYLTEAELQELEQLDLSTDLKLDRARDLFLIGCWTGLRFSDFSILSQENIVGDFIEMKTQKTGETVVIPIHKVVKDIFTKYKTEQGYSWPEPVSNVSMNSYLKTLGEMVEGLHETTPIGITKGGTYAVTNYKKYDLITTHTARRSFATNLYKDGVSALTIMKITGHRTEKAFLRYIKVTPNENALLLQRHWNKTINGKK